MQALQANMKKRKQSLTCHNKDEISQGLNNHPQPVRHDTTLRDACLGDDYNGEQKGDNKAPRSRSETAEYLCEKNR